MSISNAASDRLARFHLPADAALASREWLRAFAVFGAILADLGLLVAAGLVGSWLRFGALASERTVTLLFLIVPAYLLASLTYHAYTLETLKRRGRSILVSNLALLTAAGFAFGAAFALQVGGKLSRLETGYMLVAASVFLSIGRIFGAIWLSRLRTIVERTTFILGDEDAFSAGRADKIFNVRHLNWQPSADDPGFLDAMCRTFRHADRVVLVFRDLEERIAWANFMRLTGLSAEVVEPQLARVVPIGIDKWSDSPTLVVSRGPLSLQERVAKRLLDLTLTILAAPVAVPLVAVLAILVKLESPGPSFFAQDRVGKKNGTYRCYKLRTMRSDVLDGRGDRSAARDDERITPMGRWLRKTSLDELPQLWNVFLGNMSLVGPRPHALGSTAEGALFWNAVDGYWVRHSVKPGITGLAQVRGLRGATTSRQDIAERVAADLEYINAWSFWLDIHILIRTPLVIVHRNAF